MNKKARSPTAALTTKARELTEPGKVLFHPRSCQIGGPYLVDADDPRYARREVCDCGWAPELGMHYRVGGA